jgi:flagellar biosynthetic protein FliR
MTGIITELSGLLDLAEGVAWAAVLVFLRVGAMVALMPGFGETAVPPRVKLALVLAFTVAITPILAERLPVAGSGSDMAMLGAEAVAGLILGVGMRLFLLGLQTAAAIIAQATTLSQLFGGAGPEPQPAIGNLLTMAGIALAMAAGLHVRAAELVVVSYDILPPGLFPDAGIAADWGLALVGRTFALAFSLAAPFVIAGMIYNLALGAINRAMPQLMVSMVGAPALTLGALALLAVVAPVLLSVWLGAFHDHLADPFRGPP